MHNFTVGVIYALNCNIQTVYVIIVKNEILVNKYLYFSVYFFYIFKRIYIYLGVAALSPKMLALVRPLSLILKYMRNMLCISYQ